MVLESGGELLYTVGSGIHESLKTRTQCAFKV